MYFHRKCKITFICHGATIYSEEGRFSDAYDVTMLDGGTYGYSDKHHNAYVRAVAAF